MVAKDQTVLCRDDPVRDFLRLASFDCAGTSQAILKDLVIKGLTPSNFQLFDFEFRDPTKDDLRITSFFNGSEVEDIRDEMVSLNKSIEINERRPNPIHDFNFEASKDKILTSGPLRAFFKPKEDLLVDSFIGLNTTSLDSKNIHPIDNSANSNSYYAISGMRGNTVVSPKSSAYKRMAFNPSPSYLSEDGNGAPDILSRVSNKLYSDFVLPKSNVMNQNKECITNNAIEDITHVEVLRPKSSIKLQPLGWERSAARRDPAHADSSVFCGIPRYSHESTTIQCTSKTPDEGSWPGENLLKQKDLVQNALSALQGIPSSLFKFDLVTLEVSIRGKWSSGATGSMLAVFAEAGEQFRRLERVAQQCDTDDEILLSFSNELFNQISFIRHEVSHLTELPIATLLELVTHSKRVRSLITTLAQSCGCEYNFPSIRREGVLNYLFLHASALDVSNALRSNSLNRIALFSLFQAATAPIFSYFAGRLWGGDRKKFQGSIFEKWWHSSNLLSKDIVQRADSSGRVLDLLREAFSNAPEYYRAVYSSGLPKLSLWLTSNDRDVLIEERKKAVSKLEHELEARKCDENEKEAEKNKMRDAFFRKARIERKERRRLAEQNGIEKRRKWEQITVNDAIARLKVKTELEEQKLRQEKQLLLRNKNDLQMKHQAIANNAKEKRLNYEKLQNIADKRATVAQWRLNRRYRLPVANQQLKTLHKEELEKLKHEKNSSVGLNSKAIPLPKSNETKNVMNESCIVEDATDELMDICDNLSVSPTATKNLDDHAEESVKNLEQKFFKTTISSSISSSNFNVEQFLKESIESLSDDQKSFPPMLTSVNVPILQGSSLKTEKKMVSKAPEWSLFRPIEVNNEFDEETVRNFSNDAMPLVKRIYQCLEIPVLLQCDAIDKVGFLYYTYECDLAGHVNAMRNFLLCQGSSFTQDFAERLHRGLIGSVGHRRVDWSKEYNVRNAFAASANITRLENFQYFSRFSFMVGDPLLMHNSESQFHPAALDHIRPQYELCSPLKSLIPDSTVKLYHQVHFLVFQQTLCAVRLRWIGSYLKEAEYVSPRPSRVLRWLHTFRHELQHLCDCFLSHISARIHEGWETLYSRLKSPPRTGSDILSIGDEHRHYIESVHYKCFLGPQPDSVNNQVIFRIFYRMVCELECILSKVDPSECGHKESIVEELMAKRLQFRRNIHHLQKNLENSLLTAQSSDHMQSLLLHIGYGH